MQHSLVRSYNQDWARSSGFGSYVSNSPCQNYLNSCFILEIFHSRYQHKLANPLYKRYIVKLITLVSYSSVNYCFCAFPHGTSSLSLIIPYLVLEESSPIFKQFLDHFTYFFLLLILYYYFPYIFRIKLKKWKFLLSIIYFLLSIYESPSPSLCDGDGDWSIAPGVLRRGRCIIMLSLYFLIRIRLFSFRSRLL